MCMILKKSNKYIIYFIIVLCFVSQLWNNMINVRAADSNNDQTPVSVSNNSINLSEQQRNQLRGYWEGTFYATSGDIKVNISIRFKVVSVSSDGFVQAYFYFIASPDSTASPYGCYTMTGTYNPKTSSIQMDGLEYIVAPESYPFIAMDAIVNLNGGSIEGSARYLGKNYNGLHLSKIKDLLVDSDLSLDITMQEYLQDFADAGYGDIADTIKVEYNNKKYVIRPEIDGQWNIVTLCVGNKVRVDNYFDKKTFKSSNKSIASVSSKGVITAKKSGQVTITYKSNGIEQVINVKVKKPTLVSKADNTKIKKLMATVIQGDNFDIALQVPLDTVLQNKVNKDVVNDLTVKLDKEGNYRITGNALKKGKVKMYFICNGKKMVININVKKKK